MLKTMHTGDRLGELGPAGRGGKCKEGEYNEQCRDSNGMTINYLGGLVTSSVIHLIATALIRTFNF